MMHMSVITGIPNSRGLYYHHACVRWVIEAMHNYIFINKCLLDGRFHPVKTN